MANNWKITNNNKAEIVELLEAAPRIAYWELALAMGLHENTISKYMRAPSDEQAAAIKAAIKDIRAEQKAN